MVIDFIGFNRFQRHKVEVGMDREVVRLLACPVTKQGLRLIEGAEVEKVRGIVPEGQYALIREDGKIVYPIIEGIAVLLPEAGRAV